MNHRMITNKNGFTLIELVVVIAILGILATVLVPIINSFLETANQATDSANAHLIYNSAAMWYAENNRAESELLPTDVSFFLGLSEYPPAKSRAYGGVFSVAVATNGIVTVKTTKPAVYDPTTGKLKS